MQRVRLLVGVGWASLSLLGGATLGQQVVPWDFFEDDASNSACEIVNGANDRFLVLSGTRQLVVVTGPDVLLVETEVDEFGCVFYEGEQAGFIEFATDADGLRSLWWLSGQGTVVDLVGINPEPVETDLFPDEFTDVPCDACEFWDDRSVCDDEPLPPDDGGLPGLIVNVCFPGAELSLGLCLLSMIGLRLVRGRRCLS
jgi:hypothetical protein